MKRTTRDEFVGTPVSGRILRFAKGTGLAFTSTALALCLAGNSVAHALNATGPASQQQNATAPASQQQSAAPTQKASKADAKSVTVLIYMNGSDLESDFGAGSDDLAEMLKSKVGTNVNVVIETLGTRKWHSNNIASDHSQRYIIKNGKLELVDDSLPQLDTTDPKTLSDFVGWGTSHYPADRYMLILWDHGGGPVNGFGVDEFVQDENASLTIDEMKSALAEHPDIHFDFIGMDACIMSSLETCYALKSACDYTILSEDFMPGIGWHYTEWLNALEANPALDTKEIGKTITDALIKDSDKDESNATLALIDEHAIDELYDAWKAFAYANTKDLLKTNYSTETTWDYEPNAQGTSTQGTQNTDTQSTHARPQHFYDTLDTYGQNGFGNSPYTDYFTSPFGYGSPYGNEEDLWNQMLEMWELDGSDITMGSYSVTDLLQVAQSKDTPEAKRLKEAMDKALTYYKATEGDSKLGGISVTLPYGDAESYNKLTSIFANSGRDKEYIDWLKQFVEAEGANSYYNYEDLGYSNNHSSPYGYDSNDYGYTYDYDGYGNGYGYGNNYGCNGYLYNNGFTDLFSA